MAAALTGTMATTAFTAPTDRTDPIAAATADETEPVTVSKEGNGKVAISQDGNEPVFDDFPSQNESVQAAVGDTVILSAKADEGWKLIR